MIELTSASQVEAWAQAIREIREESPDVVLGSSPIEWTFLSARAAIRSGLIEGVEADQDVDALPIWRVKQVGEEFMVAYDKAMTIPPNGSAPSATT